MFIFDFFQKIGQWYTKAAVEDAKGQKDQILWALMEVIFLYNTDGIENQLKKPQTYTSMLAKPIIPIIAVKNSDISYDFWNVNCRAS